MDYYDGSHANQDATLMVISCFVRKKNVHYGKEKPLSLRRMFPRGEEAILGRNVLCSQ